MNDEKNKMLLEEYKELGQEYRYRDQLMVQEFGLAMVAIGVVVNCLWGADDITWSYLAVQIIAGLFIAILAFHLTHLNEDRRAILELHEQLRRDKLGFEAFHKGAGGARFSAPRTMIWFSYLLIAAWGIWIVVSIYSKFTAC